LNLSVSLSLSLIVRLSEALSAVSLSLVRLSKALFAVSLDLSLSIGRLSLSLKS
jgi:hypothetical protein